MIDIIIVNYNSGTLIRDCISHVEANTGSPYNLTIVDNASSDMSRIFLECYSGGRVMLLHKNLGFSAAFNHAVQYTKTDILIGLDDDALVPAGWDRQIVSHLTGTCALAGAKIVFPDNRLFCAECSVYPPGIIGFGEYDRGQRDYTRPVDAVAGTCFAVQRDAFLEVGQFDEKMFPCQYEDIEFAYRIRKAGYRIMYDGTLKIVHHNLFRSLNREHANKRYFLSKHDLAREYPLDDSHPYDALRARGYRLWEYKRYAEAHELLSDLYQHVEFPPDYFYFDTLAKLKMHDELRALYRKRKQFVR